MIAWDATLLPMYKNWHWDQVSTQDLDPVYPWLKAYQSLTDCDKDEAASLTLCYLTWYNVASAVSAWTSGGRSIPETAPHLPTGVERRAHRSMIKLQQHLNDLRGSVNGQPHAWMTDAGSWERMTDRVMSVKGNGRWAAYKACDLAVNVHGATWVAPDAGHAHSTGPRKGLAILGVDDPGGNNDGAIAYLNKATEELATLVGETDLSRIETSLCDFQNHLKGKHPLGHDIGILRKQAERIPQGPQAMEMAGL